MSLQEDMALAWGGIFTGIGVVALWAAVDSQSLGVRGILALFGVALVGFGAYTMVFRTWPTRGR